MVVDKWGIPVLRFHFAWSDHEIKMAKDMQETFRAIVEAGRRNRVDQPTANAGRPKRHPTESPKGERSFMSLERCGWETIRRPRF